MKGHFVLKGRQDGEERDVRRPDVQDGGELKLFGRGLTGHRRRQRSPEQKIAGGRVHSGKLHLPEDSVPAFRECGLAL